MREIEPSEVSYEVFFLLKKRLSPNFGISPPKEKNKKPRHLSIALALLEHRNLAF